MVVSATSFVGRERELAELAALLSTPGCRLLTILGLGGSGKTRVARELAARQAPFFADGAAFVPLQSLESSAEIVTALSRVLSLPHVGDQDPQARLLTVLRERELLVVFDNFEHLLDGAEICSAILAAAPRVRLLTTSREALLLQEEWIYRLDGLDLPRASTPEAIESSAAIRLFIQRACQQRTDFDPIAERGAIARICTHLAGLPLAIELAAVWVRHLSCDLIADKIAQGLSLLTSQLRNLPPRHRSIQIVLDETLQQLSPAAQAVFARLAVFRGSFTFDAAEDVAQAKPDLLALLVDRSLLRYDANGRYHLHALLRQYAEQRLRDDPAELARVLDRMAGHYASFLHARWQPLQGGGQAAALAAISAEIDNIRGAWRYAATHAPAEILHRMAHPLALYYHFRGPYAEGLEMLGQVIASLRAASPSAIGERALVLALIDSAWLNLRLGRIDTADTAFRESHELLARLAEPPPLGEATDPRLGMGLLALMRGSYAEAERLIAQAHKQAISGNSRLDQPYTWWLLARLALVQGHLTTARHLARQGVAAAEAHRDALVLGFCLVELGEVEYMLGNYDEAQRHYETSYALRNVLDDPQGMAETLVLLGRVELQRGKALDALERFRESQAIFHTIGDLSRVAQMLNAQALAYAAIGDDKGAQTALADALELATASGYVPHTLAALGAAGELLLRAGRAELGARLLGVALAHPSSNHETSASVQQALDRYEALVHPDLLASAAAQARTIDLDALASQTREALAAVSLKPFTKPATLSAVPRRLHALCEPLTGREREVLELLAAGLTNKAIAQRLTVSVNTVQSHVSAILGKLGVDNRTTAVIVAIEAGLIHSQSA